VLVTRKGEPGVDDDEVASALEDGEVLPDLPQAAERHDPARFHRFSV
jgi:hypothetical protein